MHPATRKPLPAPAAALAACLALLAVAAVPAAGAASDLPPPGGAVERALAGGGSHLYRVELPRGHFLRVVVTQQEIDLVLRLRGPGLDEPLEIDSPGGGRGREYLAHVAAAAGSFELEVASQKRDAPAGSYRLAVEAVRAATPRDELLVEAERSEQQALIDGWVTATAESRRRAVESYERAAELWRRLGEPQRRASVLNDLAFLLRRMGEIPRQAEVFERLLELERGLGDRTEEARTRSNLAASYLSLGRLDEAEAMLHRALTIFEEVGRGDLAASTLHALGSLHLRRGQPRQALDELDAALEHSRAAGATRDPPLVLNSLGLAHQDLGEYAPAVEAFEAALEGAVAEGDGVREAAIRNNLGTAYQYQGRFREALEQYRRAQDLHHRQGNRRGEAFLLNNLGTLYNLLGKPRLALDYYRRGLELHSELGDRLAEVRVLANLGWVYLQLEDAGTAVEWLERGLALARELESRKHEAEALSLLGEAERELGDLEASDRLLRQAVGIYRELGLLPLATTSEVRLARTLRERGDLEGSLELLRRGLATVREIHRPGVEALILAELAAGERRRGHLESARLHLEGALRVLEELRAAVAIQELQASLFAHRRRHYEEYVDLLMELHRHHPGAGWDARAFEAAERGRARSLLDLLREAEVDLRQDAPAELLRRERELRHRLNVLERRRLEAGEADRPGIEGELERVRRDHQWAESQIRVSSPRYAALTDPEPLSAAQVRRDLLGDGSTLLEYTLGEERSFLWVLSPAGLTSHELPPRRVLERAARRYHELLSTGGDAAQAGTELARLLLAPAAAHLGGDGPEAARLVVVPDGALHYLPFAALPDPTAPDGTPRPLVVDHEVVYLPSVTALAVLRRDFGRRPPAPRTLAVFADPVFQPTDPRVAPAVEDGTADGGASAIRRTGTGQLSPDLDFRRLRFSRREAERIAALVPREERLQALDFAASRETVEEAPLERYRLLHFATHGVLHAEYPELSGLVLSLVDARGEPADGFLRLHDVYRLQLNAELVTLSACRTALGQEIRGEGLVGLTRGFMYAGAERVLASLWDVQDRATAEMMARLYAGLLRDGLSPAAALRRAQVSMWNDPRWSSPYYWAPFVVQGDWVQGDRVRDGRN